MGMATQDPSQILNPVFSDSVKGCIRKGVGDRKVASWHGALCIQSARSQP